MKKKIFIFGILILVLLSYVVFAAEPGSKDDPLVSQSYIEEVIIPQMVEYIDNKVANVEEQYNNEDNNSETDKELNSFRVVSVKKDQKLIGGNGTELILRMGTGNIIATEKGGIADVTIGTDLPNGDKIPANHLLIIPLSDGRGIIAASDMLVMVKGAYIIE